MCKYYKSKVMHASLALQDNDTKVRDRVIYIYDEVSLYTNITG